MSTNDESEFSEVKKNIKNTEQTSMFRTKIIGGLHEKDVQDYISDIVSGYRKELDILIEKNSVLAKRNKHEIECKNSIQSKMENTFKEEILNKRKVLDDLEQAKNEIKHLLKEQQEMKEKNDILTQKLLDYENKSALNINIDTSDEQTSFKKEISDLEETNEKLQIVNDNLIKEKQVLNEKNRLLHNQLANTKNIPHNANQKEVERIITQLQNEISILSERNIKLVSEIENINKVSATRTGDLKQLQIIIDTFIKEKNELEKSQDEIEKLNEIIENLKTKTNELNTNLNENLLLNEDLKRELEIEKKNTLDERNELIEILTFLEDIDEKISLQNKQRESFFNQNIDDTNILKIETEKRIDKLKFRIKK